MQNIDAFSYQCGVIDCFNEMVHAGLKTLALSRPMDSAQERDELIRQESAYGNIICRCEMITEGEILDAIRRPLGARSLDGIKRRTRAGMGRCQSGFCSPRVMEILARELGLDISDITKSGPRSLIIEGSNKHI